MATVISTGERRVRLITSSVCEGGVVHAKVAGTSCFHSFARMRDGSISSGCGEGLRYTLKRTTSNEGDLIMKVRRGCVPRYAVSIVEGIVPRYAFRGTARMLGSTECVGAVRSVEKLTRTTEITSTTRRGLCRVSRGRKGCARLSV